MLGLSVARYSVAVISIAPNPLPLIVVGGVQHHAAVSAHLFLVTVSLKELKEESFDAEPLVPSPVEARPFTCCPPFLHVSRVCNKNDGIRF